MIEPSQTVAPPLAGALRVALPAFLLYDLAGSALRAGAGLALGVAFRGEISRLLDWLAARPLSGGIDAWASAGLALERASACVGITEQRELAAALDRGREEIRIARPRRCELALRHRVRYACG